MKLTYSVQFVSLFLTGVFSSPINNPQAFLAFNNEPHPILDRLIENGIFSKAEITNDISTAWEFLEEKASEKEIEEHLKFYIGGQSPLKMNTLPKTKIEGINDKYDYVTSNSLSKYSLRVDKHLKSNPLELGVDSVKQHTGYFDINEDDKHMFFWFFESRNDPTNDPVILWLNGGPGCSSMTGLFFELGPSSINGTTLTPVYNPWSWNSNASVIFLEQPVGVGYSYAEKSSVSTTSQASKDVFAFLQLFFSHFSKFANNDFHIAGESYAGHYIPGIAHEIVNNEDKVFDLKSVMIGNGLTDSLVQYYYYIPMACNSTESGFKQLISDNECQNLEVMYSRCASLIESCYKTQTALTCLPANLYCEKMMGPFEKTGLNYYDIRKPCLGAGCYPEMEAVDKYLNQPQVLKALGSEVDSYVGCDDIVFRNFIFSGDEPKPFQQYVSELLDADIPVLIYAGDKDYICNWLGNQAWINELEWKNAESFKNAKTNKWYSNYTQSEAGTVQSNGQLTFLRIYDAGHMVPFDQPANSLDFVNKWINGDYEMN
ncbi:carboxypeptidase C [Martiniozyma asiatica (nom. inval.)]|nr:carboxypeptidase C [Martiniozyma asiatica]